MTPERKKYLAGISKEEQAIRYAIKHQQDVISNCKEDLTNPWLFSTPANILKLQIADTKAIIKHLKKQLPAPKKYYIASNFVCCPVCNYILDSGCNDYYKNYCPDCGQKLR